MTKFVEGSGITRSLSQFPAPPFVIPTRERSETGGICCLPGTAEAAYPGHAATLCPDLVDAMGVELKIIARFPEGTVEISQFVGG